MTRILRRSPGPIKSAIYRSVPFGYRYGKHFRRYLRQAMQRDQWPLDFQYEYQTMMLRVAIERAYLTPYYRRIIKNAQIDPLEWREGNPRIFLLRLPVTTKEDLRVNHHHMVLPVDRPTTLHTSGSTGVSIMIHADKDVYERENAFQERAFRSHGGSLMFGRSVWVKRYIPSLGQSLYAYDPERQWLMLSPYHITGATIRNYVEWINDFGAKTLVGYPSSIYLLARAIAECPERLRLKHIQAIHVASELMPMKWEHVITGVTGIAPRDHYGMMERCAFFHRCNHGQGYHESLDYGYTEIVDGHVVATGFINKGMALLRYSIGDLAERTSERCGCGSKLPITVRRFAGRSGDLMQADDGHLIPSVNLYTLMYRVENVDMFRITQLTRRTVLVEVVPKRDCDLMNSIMRFEIDHELHKRFGSKMHIEIDTVPEIERSTETGKIQCVRNMIGSDQ